MLVDFINALFVILVPVFPLCCIPFFVGAVNYTGIVLNSSFVPSTYDWIPIISFGVVLCLMRGFGDPVA